MDSLNPQLLGLYIGQIFSYDYNGARHIRPMDAIDILVVGEDYENCKLMLKSLRNISLEHIQKLFDLAAEDLSRTTGDEMFPPKVLGFRFPDKDNTPTLIEMMHEVGMMESFNDIYCFCDLDFEGDIRKDFPLPLSLFSANQMVFLAQQGYDLFGLIENGDAVEVE